MRPWSIRTCIGFAVFILAVTGQAIAVNTHPATPPAGVTLPQAADRTFAFLEGELQAPGRDDTLDQEHRDATFFCDNRSPDDQYWAEPAGYDGCRAATRGAAASHKDHRFEWRGVGAHLKPGVYDVYIRANVASGGSASYSLTTSAGDVESLQGVKNEKANISWFRLGSVMIEEATESLTLKVETTNSPVWLDTVLLVSPDHVEQAAELERIPGQEAWASARSVIFAADRGELLYELTGGGSVKGVTYSLQDEAGRFMVRGASAASSSTNRWSVELPARGYYDVTIRADRASGQPLETNITAAVIGEPLDETLRMASRFGVWNVHGDTRLAVLAGSRWNRRMTAFFGVERESVTEGPWTRAENASDMNEMDHVGVFAFGLPEWLMDLPDDHKRPSYGNPFYPANDSELLADLVSHYASIKPLPDLVEMYNEPDAHWHGTDEQLIDYARAVRQGLLAVDPNFKLLGPCFYSIRMSDLNRLASKGLYDYLDGVAMHAYVNGTPPEGEFVERFSELKQFVAESSKPDMSIYLTEFGWTRASGTWQEPVDTLTQARYCARSLILGMAEDIDVLIYFALQYKTTNKGEAAFSLIDPEDRLSPAYVAFATIVKFFAAAEPVGRWAITPTSHLVLGQRDGQVLAAIWDTQGTQAVRLPWPVSRAMSMMGTPVEVGDGNHIEISQSPIYLVLDAPALAGIQTTETIETTIGGRESVTSIDGMLAELDPYAAPGEYTAFNLTGDGWTAQPVTIHQPVRLVETKVVWPSDADHPHIASAVQSNLTEESVTVRARVEPGASVEEVTLPPRSIRTLRFPIEGVALGERATRKLHVEAGISGQPLVLSDEVEVTVVSATEVDDVRSAWPDRVPAIDFTDWAPFPTSDSAAGQDRMDCSANFRAIYGEAGLRVEVVVTDDEHRAPAPGDTAQDGWARDSIQLAFDLDADKPWTAGVVGAGLAGHRVFEFTISQRPVSPDSPGDAWVFRHRSYTDSLPANQTVENAVASVTREGGQTRYDVFLPWEALAVTSAMKIGDAIGIAIAVNDVDPLAARSRHGLRLFEGIVQTKDAKRFGRLWLR